MAHDFKKKAGQNKQYIGAVVTVEGGDSPREFIRMDSEHAADLGEWA